jgi:hypothetical protein
VASAVHGGRAYHSEHRDVTARFATWLWGLVGQNITWSTEWGHERANASGHELL